MVETGVQTDLVHDNDTGLLAALLESLHGRGDVRGSHDIGLRVISLVLVGIGLRTNVPWCG